MRSCGRQNVSTAVLNEKWGHLNNFEFVMNRAYALNRDRLKCRVCGKWLIDSTPYTHRINPRLPLDRVNRVNNLISVHRKCYQAINMPGMRIIQNAIFEEACVQAEELADDRVLVVNSDGWNHGVIGIVASKLVEKYNKPVFISNGSIPR